MSVVIDFRVSVVAGTKAAPVVIHQASWPVQPGFGSSCDCRLSLPPPILFAPGRREPSFAATHLGRLGLGWSSVRPHHFDVVPNYPVRLSAHQLLLVRKGEGIQKFGQEAPPFFVPGWEYKYSRKHIIFASQNC